jgi:NADH-quinone oxidoreductase subunit A
METQSIESIQLDYLAILIQFVVASSFVIGTFYLTHKLGPKHKSEKKLQSFECGLDSIGDARLPFSVKYFLAAILFVLFDAEVIFFYPWAVNFRELGEEGFIKMILFVTPFMLGFYYVIKKGALKWE